MNFQHHPHQWYYTDSSLEYETAFAFDELFPFPENDTFRIDKWRNPKNRKLVRSLDAIMLVSRNREAFWATVVSVASNGMIEAESKADVPSLRLNELLVVPIIHVLGVNNGPNHPPNTTKSKSRKRRNLNT